MITVCSNCSSRVQIDDDNRSASRVLRCPKCNSDLHASPPSPAFEKSALAVGSSPSTEVRRYEHPSPAPLFEPDPNSSKSNAFLEGENLVKLLASLLTQKDNATTDSRERAPWDPRKALVCTPDEYRSKIAKALTNDGYKVFVATDTKQAVERMRENQLDVVLLEPQFDCAEQGAAFVAREVNVLRPAQRRRIFFVLLSPSLRTMDAHTAFLNNVNAVVNVKDLDDLVRVLNHGLRDYNELYKDFNMTLKLAAI